uniref:Flagella associated protein putative n=1 Tax=Albugo laibachii Nc14 TaxID=890382 RepID=F0WDP3_9STRA|nr:flagella associated protein putative [Albugo laibachii Nc14]|eukprot:CCA19319.1 flagella associated protein putative [Albugo laibachii Nc14]
MEELEMPDMEQCALLQSIIHEPLTEAFKQLAIVQPNDPVEFLGKYLLKYDKNIAEKEKLHLVNQEASTRRQQPLKEEEVFGDDCSEKVCFEKMTKKDQFEKETDTISMLYDVMLRWLVQHTSAQEAYIGKRRIDKDGSSTLWWIASSKQNKSLVINRTLKEDESPVTFGAFKKLNQETAEQTDQNSLNNQFPTFVHIENVLREPKMFFFGVPKIGAYLTRALSYRSHLHADVYNEVEPGSPHTKVETVIISMDTIGQADAFTAQDIDTYLFLTDLFVERLEKIEHRSYLTAIDQMEVKKVEWQNFLDAIQARISDYEEDILRNVQDLSENDKMEKESEMRFAFLTALFKENTKQLFKISSWSIPPKSASASVIASCCALLGYPVFDINKSAYGKLEWSILASYFDKNGLQCKVEAISNDKEFLAPKKCSQAALLLRDKENGHEVTQVDLEREQNPAAIFLYRWIVAGLKRSETLSAEFQPEQDSTP